MNSLEDLKNNQTLFVGEDLVFQNFEASTTAEQYLTYLVSVKYVLRRASSSYNLSVPYVSYEGYYYYWDSTSVSDEELLGTRTENSVCTYSYMAYGENNENIMIRKTLEKQTSFSYTEKWIEKPVSVTVELNNYFASVDEMAELCPELMERVDFSATRKYYIDVTVPTTKDITSNTYKDTYFYLEQR